MCKSLQLGHFEREIFKCRLCFKLLISFFSCEKKSSVEEVVKPKMQPKQSHNNLARPLQVRTTLFGSLSMAKYDILTCEWDLNLYLQLFACYTKFLCNIDKNFVYQIIYLRSH